MKVTINGEACEGARAELHVRPLGQVVLTVPYEDRARLARLVHGVDEVTVSVYGDPGQLMYEAVGPVSAYSLVERDGKPVEEARIAYTALKLA